VYMGVLSLPEISAQLIRHGLPPDTPAACVRRATHPDQFTVTGTIATLPDRVVRANLRPPALLIVGQVAALHERFCWFERAGTEFNQQA
jgi:siroheme synthase